MHVVHIVCYLLAVVLTTAAVHIPASRPTHQLRVWSYDGSVIRASFPSILCMDVQDSFGSDELHPLRLQQLHSRLLHIVFIPATYSSVLHVHLEDYPDLFHAYLTSDQCAAVNVTLPSAGRWLVGVNIWPTDAPSMVTTSVVIDVDGDPVGTDFPVDTHSSQVVQPLQLQPNQIYSAAVQRSTPTTSTNRSVIIDVQLDRDERPIRAGACCPLALSVSTSDTKQPVEDLLPLLTLPAHLFLFYYNSSTHEYYFHHLHAPSAHDSLPAHCSAHAMGSMMPTMDVRHVPVMNGMGEQSYTAKEKFGPMVQAASVQFDCPGRWLIIGQLRRASDKGETSDGELLTVMMDVMVE